MKLLVFVALLTASLFGSSLVYGEEGYFKKKFVNIGFVNSTLQQDGCPDLKSNYGVSFTVGRSYYLHKKPLLNVLKLGIDANWFDITYTNYDVEHITTKETNKFQIHQGDAGMQFGPSLTINPMGKMVMHAYLKVAPTFAFCYVDDKFQGKYATYFVGGGSLSYGGFGLGVEWRQGSTKFDPLVNLANIPSDSKSLKTKTTGIRAYVTFSF